jgi:membrane associated rhomboid family serine protease
MSLTIFILLITFLISYMAFQNASLREKLILWPEAMNSPSEYYRFITSGFIHADWMHLLFNMLTLFFFGRYVEMLFEMYGIASSMFIVLYLAGIIIASLPSFLKNRQNRYYRSLGASGGVAAVLFSFVYFAPWETILIWFIPVPGIVAAILYIVYSAYMSRKNYDNVNHQAHIWGAVFGFVFTWIIDPYHGKYFLQQLLQPKFNF